MAKPKEENNPIIEYLHGIAIRTSNTICTRVAEDSYRDLVEQSHNTGISISKLFLIRSEPCQSCGCDNITIKVNKKKQSYRIGENGGTLVKNSNGKGQEDHNEDHPAQ